uniref:Oxidative stress-responsive serine-rich protein 1 n=1 Tax=Oryzias latipes TaxID=8090 RepID=A0A3P9IEI5_ORYLA
MEAGGQDCEEEILQTAFKKLKVDAERIPGPVSVTEAVPAKAKLSCPKEHWHCCTRKSTRGATRSQRRRRSKSPILHPPKFTYCSTSTASVLPPSGGCPKHQLLAVPEPGDPHPSVDEKTAPVVLPAPLTAHSAPLGFESGSGYDTQHGSGSSAAAAPRWEAPGSLPVQLCKESGHEKSACGGVDCGAAAQWRSKAPDAADFRALSELHSRSCAEGPHVSCPCPHGACSDVQDESGQDGGPPCSCRASRQGWAGVEVYSFTGLRNVISECEQGLPGQEDRCRTLSSSTLSSLSALPAGSPRSCSEQARAYVDDITIEDLSGYMEYYLYIPKKMSHMAEMMYT